MDVSAPLFYIFSVMVLVTAAFVAFRPRPVESAFWLILNFFATAALYVVMGSHLVAAIQVLVYAGAIMVLFVFVILLLNLDPRELGAEVSVPWSSLVIFVSFLSFVLLCLFVAQDHLLQSLPPVDKSSGFGTIEALSRVLLRDYVLAFEAAGIILLLAVIGVGLLAYRKSPAQAAAERPSS